MNPDTVREIMESQAVDEMDVVIYTTMAYRNAAVLNIKIDGLYTWQDHQEKWYLTTVVDGKHCILVQLGAYAVMAKRMYTDTKFAHLIGDRLHPNRVKNVTVFEPNEKVTEIFGN